MSIPSTLVCESSSRVGPLSGSWPPVAVAASVELPISLFMGEGKIL